MQEGHQEIPPFQNAVDFTKTLRAVESGYHSAGFIAALGNRCLEFFGALKPEHFRRMARALLDVAQDPQNWPRSRTRAVEAILQPLRRATGLIPKLIQSGDSALLEHLRLLLSAFFEEISVDEFRGLAEILMKFTEAPTNGDPRRQSKWNEDRVRAITVLLRGVTEMYQTVLDANLLEQDEQQRRPQIAPDDPRLVQAEAELDGFIAEIHKTRLVQAPP